MCVAVVVDSKDRIPEKHLEAMHEANPHGAGLAWVDGNKICYRKGMTWKEIDSVQMFIRRPFFMHFRIKTHGPTVPELTHPFPLGWQAFTKDLVGEAPAVLMHNGSWPDFRKWIPEGVDPNHVSDTQVAAFVAEWQESILKDMSWSTAIMKATNVVNRVDLTLRGRWTVIDGNQYSNDYWKKELQPKWTYSNNSNTKWNEWKGWTKERSDDLEEACKTRNWEKYNAKYNPHLVSQSRTKTQPMNQSPATTKVRKRGESRQEDSWGKGEELFTPAALARANDKDCFACNKNLGSSYRMTQGVFLHLDCDLPDINNTTKEVKCPDCLNEITVIPCSCQETLSCIECNGNNLDIYEGSFLCTDCYAWWDPNYTPLNEDTPANNGIKIVPDTDDEEGNPWRDGFVD